MTTTDQADERGSFYFLFPSDLNSLRKGRVDKLPIGIALSSNSNLLLGVGLFYFSRLSWKQTLCEELFFLFFFYIGELAGCQALVLSPERKLYNHARVSCAARYQMRHSPTVCSISRGKHSLRRIAILFFCEVLN